MQRAFAAKPKSAQASPGSTWSARPPLQRASASPSSTQHAAVPPIVHDVLRSPGQPLDAATRAFMEPRFGHDFSKVRVHADVRAAEAASSINARAFTSDRDIAFGAGEYAPQMQSGRRLVAHELTHVVQQGSGVHLHNGVGPIHDRYERHADNVARAVNEGRSTSHLLDTFRNISDRGITTGAVLQRDPVPDPELIPAAIGSIDTVFFEKKYEEDKANQKVQTKNDYLEWVQKFYKGVWLVAPGWNDQSASLLNKVTAQANKLTVKATLDSLGKAIAAEWSKYNSVRKINTDHLKKWGGQMESAKDADDGSGTKILAALAGINKEVMAQVGK